MGHPHEVDARHEACSRRAGTAGRRLGAAGSGRAARALLLAAVALLSTCLALWLWAPPAPAATRVDDWVHLWEVVRLVNAGPQPPAGPQVYYLGDSEARESVVSDAAWRVQLLKSGAPSDVSPHLLGGHNQTFGMDETVVAHLPSRAGLASRDVVVIGVGLTRFVRPPTAMDPARLGPVAPGQRIRLSPWQQHHYDSVKPVPLAQRRQFVAAWVRRSAPLARRTRAANLAALERVIKTCLQRNLTPVLLEQPLDLAATGSRVSALRGSYQSGCRDLAGKYGIGYVAFQPGRRLPATAFYDVWHLVHRGAVKWQLWLSRAVAPLLAPPAQP